MQYAAYKSIHFYIIRQHFSLYTVNTGKKTSNKKTAILKKQSAIPGDGTVP